MYGIHVFQIPETGPPQWAAASYSLVHCGCLAYCDWQWPSGPLYHGMSGEYVEIMSNSLQFFPLDCDDFTAVLHVVNCAIYQRQSEADLP